MSKNYEDKTLEERAFYWEMEALGHLHSSKLLTPLEDFIQKKVREAYLQGVADAKENNETS